MSVSPPPARDQELTSQAWQKWFSSIFSSFSKFETDNNVLIDNAASGLVLKSPNGHYWLVTVNNSGVLIQSDLGINKP